MRESRKFNLLKNVVVTAAAVALVIWLRHHVPVNWTYWLYPVIFIVWLLLVLP